MSHADDAQQQARYDAFIEGLTALTQRYGVAVQSVGGVSIAENPDEYRSLVYTADRSSGDLLPDWDALGNEQSPAPGLRR